MTSVLATISDLSTIQQRIRNDHTEFVEKYKHFAEHHRNELLEMEETKRFHFIANNFCMEKPYIFETNKEDSFGLSCSTSEVEDLTRVFAECFPGYKALWYGPEDCGGFDANIQINKINPETA